MLIGLLLALLGLLAAPNVILARTDKLKPFLKSVEPYETALGACATVVGLYVVATSLIGLRWLIAAPLVWTGRVATGVGLTALGVVLGVGIIKKVVGLVRKDAVEKVGRLSFELAPYQTWLGIAGMVVGITYVVLWFGRPI